MRTHDITPSPNGSKPIREALDERKSPAGTSHGQAAMTPGQNRIPQPGMTRGKA